MGEVYRARDTKLDREVAIKILPEAFAVDAERVARFQREARVLASLNHPNIAIIHGLEQAGDVHALVMELVPGEDLSQRIARGAIPLDEALPISRQIAEALEAAHEQGIVHRDLKPANIKLRPDGTVKVLDFGLAKALEPVSGAPNVTQSPTITTPAMTQAGIILGTAAYMSPEQARGKLADRRVDIWAFGVTLFEMLTGRRAFEGDDISITLAAVMMKEPEWRALPASTPLGLRRLLIRCLKKDPKARLRDIGEARLQVEDLLSGATEDTAPDVAPLPRAMPRRRIVAVAAAALVVVAAIAAFATWALTPPALVRLQPMRFTIVPPAAQRLAISSTVRDLALSSDGTRLVYAGGVSQQLMVRAIDQLDAVPLGSITGARAPFISPDGRWIGFFAGSMNGELKKVSITGGPPISLVRYQGLPRGASWGPDDTIVFATDDTSTGLLSIPAAGGEPTIVTTPDAAHGELDHLFPSVLPGGRAVLFTIVAAGGAANAQVAVLDLKTGQHKTLIRGGSQAEYVETGHLVYAVAGTLWSVRFDPMRLEVLSDPVPVLEQVMTMTSGAAEFSLSRQGTLVYVPGGVGNSRSLVWVDRRGQEEPIKAAPPHAYVYPRISPDGTRVAFDIRDDEADIWIWDLARQTLNRLTNAPVPDQNPVWTPDSQRLIFGSARAGTLNLFSQAANGTGTVDQLTTSPNRQIPQSISPDGTHLIVLEFMPTGPALRGLRMDSSTAAAGGQPQTEPLLQEPFGKDNGEISPDGGWLAYQSNESGQQQIYVRPFPNVETGHWLISVDGGTKPLWARNGKELFYLDRAGAMISVLVQTAPSFSAGTPTKLFDGPYFTAFANRTYDISRDGQRFLMIKDNASGGQASTPASVVVVLNWAEELKAKAPPGK
jgi:eukaryotic-like serine/threonine-protein kinase